MRSQNILRSKTINFNILYEPNDELETLIENETTKRTPPQTDKSRNTKFEITSIVG